MNNLTTTNENQLDPVALQKVLLHGNIAGLNAQQKNAYYMEVCRMVGLNPLTKPFDYIAFQGKEVLYANKGAAEQLRMVHKIGLKVVAREKIEDVYVVTAEAVNTDGRTDSSTGAVSITGLRGEALANAMMKAETKAKRRVTLSICGLNMLDETEVETIEGARPVPVQTASYSAPTAKIAPAQPWPEDGAPAPAGSAYKFQTGKFKLRTAEEIAPEELQSWISWWDKKAAQGEQLSGKLVQDLNYAREFLAYQNGNHPVQDNEDNEDVPF